MSQYLIGHIEANPCIEIHYQTTITGLVGMAHLDRVLWRHTITGARTEAKIRHVFVMAGASPRTDWLEDAIALDSKGFVLTGPDIDCGASGVHWPLRRPPMLLETSVPGVFAVGDNRANSIKRVASAVGEGSMAVHLVHRFLADVAR
jgi:thioredoxin reductase (NADPH)